MNSLADMFASGIARLMPSGRRIDDPLANIKAAARWVEGLPIGDALKRFNETSTEYTKDRLAG